MLPSSSSPRSLTRRKAWSCLLVNALVCPGLGSLVARRWSGAGQIVLALAGAAWMVAVMYQYFSDYVRLLHAPSDWASYLNSGLGGFFVFLAGWGWSIVTGISIVRSARGRSQQFPIPAESWEVPPKI